MHCHLPAIIEAAILGFAALGATICLSVIGGWAYGKATQ
jgi:hypothetical protein